MRRLRMLAIAVVLACAATGCGGAGTGSGPGTTTASATPSATPFSCAVTPNPMATDLWLTQPNGDRLDATTIGTGSTYVIFSHQTDRGKCGFYSYASDLAARHHEVTAVLFSRCFTDRSVCDHGTDDVDELVNTVRWARERGAKRVVLVGASLGGLLVLVAASQASPPVDAVASLSGVPNYEGRSAYPAVTRLRMPVLYMVALQDPDVSSEDVRGMYDKTPSTSKKLVIAPADEPGLHGWALLDDPALAARLTGFVVR